MSPLARYRRREAEEGCYPPGWRWHPLRVYRTRAMLVDDRGWRAVEFALRECLGLRPRRQYRVRLMPWGHRGRYDLPLPLLPGRRP
jgi:hypothetical protein